MVKYTNKILISTFRLAGCAHPIRRYLPWPAVWYPTTHASVSSTKTSKHGVCASGSCVNPIAAVTCVKLMRAQWENKLDVSMSKVSDAVHHYHNKPHSLVSCFVLIAMSCMLLVLMLLQPVVHCLPMPSLNCTALKLSYHKFQVHYAHFNVLQKQPATTGGVGATTLDFCLIRAYDDAIDWLAGHQPLASGVTKGAWVPGATFKGRIFKRRYRFLRVRLRESVTGQRNGHTSTLL